MFMWLGIDENSFDEAVAQMNQPNIFELAKAFETGKQYEIIISFIQNIH